MHLRPLVVADFRSCEKAELDLEPGVTVLVGPNGVGKTNLVEAAGYLATLGSHRVANHEDPRAIDGLDARPQRQFERASLRSTSTCPVCAPKPRGS